MATPAPVNHDREPYALDRRSETAPVLDLVHLSRQTMGDQSLEAELLSLFDRQAAQFAPRLAEPCRPDEIGARANLIHTLKGSSRAVGAFALGEAAEAYEAAMRAGAPDDAGHRERLLAQIAAARAAIGKLLERG
ncbi:Hpt domain-containing protein [Methylocystis parvus]|uniref:Histidine phosphotransferase n=1 Tax=Methylocystis parvus TaxID=134 RepID=A0A6B8MC29_9HYPH|nr:Hpt domain-containing protein [Methylocystis parvus]QGM98220.1 histidine phosphotransferase [Methylocystis parvus]WBK01452.1 Hpt domain-containing protein [Methylocystis parvus OBBP]